MKKIFIAFFLLFAFSIIPTFAQNINESDNQQLFEKLKIEYPAKYFGAKNFLSEITLNKDSSLTVREKIDVEFFARKHGIYRVIPFIYRRDGANYITPINIVSVVDENGVDVQYKKDIVNQSIQLKIGDPDITIVGSKTYIITYNIQRVLQTYKDFIEVYWNSVGHEWETYITSANVVFKSDFAQIINAKCYKGIYRTLENNCVFQKENNILRVRSLSPILTNEDLTLVVSLSKNNLLIKEGNLEKIYFYILDNWGYLIFSTPLLIIFLAWWFSGRDKTYIFGNVFYKPENKAEKNTSIFDRQHLPMVYSPISNLTPSQIGVIFDERVDMKDIISEILELARLGYLKIHKTEEKVLFWKETNYQFEKIEKDVSSLEKHQNTIFKSIFSSENFVKMSDLQDKFYLHLDDIKDDIYKTLINKGIFPSNPIKSVSFWISIYFFALLLPVGIGVVIYASMMTDGLPLVLFVLCGSLGFLFAKSMGRRTAWGHSLFRQTVGLRWYVNEGKWRQEIAEKNLFFEEILPIAIALGVVNKLAQDMKMLGVTPPSYFTFSSMNSFANDFNHFSKSTSSTFSSAPSGHSSWSGSSGFSSGGGFSGGGFGGGGGGSW